MLKLILLINSLSLSGLVLAHPVIYKDGWVYQGSFMPKMADISVSYTFNPRYAITMNSNRFEELDNYQDYTLGLNVLVKRWLNQDSQGNVYLGAHLGQFEDFDHRGEAGHAFFMADWEDREDYFVFKSKRYFFQEKEIQDFMVRYGVAPYVAGMNELQTWAIVQAYYFEAQSESLLLTPMLRFFYKNVLWEIGSSTTGDSFINLMIHY
jgi:hypothetical protein